MKFYELKCSVIKIKIQKQGAIKYKRGSCWIRTDDQFVMSELL